MVFLETSVNVHAEASRYFNLLKHCRTAEEVVENGLCIGCGLCEAIAGRERIRMEMSPAGQMRPAFLAPLDAETQARIVRACPGVLIDGAPPDPGATRVEDDTDFGAMTYLGRGYAGEDEVRFVGASGGTLTALAIFLLETGKVDFILHVGTPNETPLRSVPAISTTRAEVFSRAGSRYGPVATLRDFPRLLDEGQRFALVGKPCEISAARNLAKTDPRVDRLVPYMLTFICGGVPDLASTERIIARHGLVERDVAYLRYRGHGWPGLTRIETKAGQAFEMTYKEAWIDEPYTMQFRCKICPDSVGLGADISIADPWLPEAPRAEFRDGWSSVIARTRRGSELLDEAVAAGALHLESYSMAELRASQNYHVRRRAAVLARLAAMVVTGARIPRFRNLRLWRSAWQSTLIKHIENMLGTIRRLGRGQARETLMRSHEEAAAAGYKGATGWDGAEGSWAPR